MTPSNSNESMIFFSRQSANQAEHHLVDGDDEDALGTVLHLQCFPSQVAFWISLHINLCSSTDSSWCGSDTCYVGCISCENVLCKMGYGEGR